MTSFSSEANRKLGERKQPGFATSSNPLDYLLSGEKSINWLSDEVLEKIPGWGKDRHSGTRIMDTIRSIPGAGGPLGWLADTATSPLTLLTAGFGGPLAAGLKGAGAAGKVAAGFISPIAKSGGFGTRVAAETGVAGAGAVAAEGAGRLAGAFTDDEKAQLAARIVGGLGGAAFGARSLGNAQAYYKLTPGERSLDLADPRRKLVDALDGREKLAPQALPDLQRGYGRASKGGIGDFGRSENRPTAALEFEAGQRRSEDFDIAETPWAKGRGPWVDPNTPVDVRVAGAGRQAGRGPSFELSGQNRRQRQQAVAAVKQAPLPDYAPPDLQPGDVLGLHKFIQDYKPFHDDRNAAEKLRATGALNRLLVGEEVGSRDLGLLSKALGVQLDLRNASKKEIWHDALNLPRSLVSSVDVSAPFQQGAVAIGRKEWWQAWGPMMKALVSPKYADEVQQGVFNRPNALRGDEAGLYLAGDDLLGPREEAYRSALAEVLPGVGPLVKASGRAYTTFLNKLRADLFDNFVARGTRQGAERTPEELKEYAAWVNTVTGRGNLGEGGVARMVADSSGLLFAPRYLWSRGELLNPQTYLKASPEIQKEMARDMATFITTGIGALSLMALTAKAAKASGATSEDAHFSLDPRSADFGQVRVGNTRYDPWGGLRPLVRYGAQILSGQRKTSGGDIVEANRLASVGRFAQSKLAPAPGFAVDWLKGETFMGETFDLATTGGITDQMAARMAPLFLQTLGDAVRAESGLGALKALPAAVGFGTQIYGDYGQVRNDKAMQDFNLPWDRLTATQKGDLERRHAEELFKVDRAAKEGEFRFEQLKVGRGHTVCREAGRGGPRRGRHGQAHVQRYDAGHRAPARHRAQADARRYGAQG